jgi:hypothetical protein
MRKPHSPTRGWNDSEEIKFIGSPTQRCTAGQALEVLLSNFLGILEGYQSRGLVSQVDSGSEVDRVCRQRPWAAGRRLGRFQQGVGRRAEPQLRQ